MRSYDSTYRHKDIYTLTNIHSVGYLTRKCTHSRCAHTVAYVCAHSFLPAEVLPFVLNRDIPGLISTDVA